MTARQLLSTATEWMFRTASVRAARAGIATLEPRRERALGQARLLLEIASRVRFPVERFPKGRRPAVLVSLYRDAITCALAAQRPGDDPPPRDLQALWAAAAPGELARAAGGTATLDAASRVLFEVPASGALDISAREADAAGALAKGLARDVDAAQHRLDRLIAQRWVRIVLVVGVLLALALGVRRLLRGPDLAANAALRLSSSWSGCASDPPCTALLFHTDPEPNPWAELDLGAPKTIRRIEISNRTDCCSERAVPLIVESSTDRTNWTSLGRRETEFQSWTLTFKPRLARYVKVRVPKSTAFHLKDIAIR